MLVRVRSRAAGPGAGKERARGTQGDVNGHSCMGTNIRRYGRGVDKQCIKLVSDCNISAKQLSVRVGDAPCSRDVGPPPNSPFITYG